MKATRSLVAFVIAAFLIAGIASCNDNAKKLEEKEKELAELRQLAELDKKEMENQYAEFATQYSELKQGIKDDSLVAQLEKEQQRAEQLLQELKRTQASSSAEILRLKKELASVRAILRDYIRQVDSLQQLNIQLVGERDMARAEAERTRAENTNINQQNQALNEKVAIAAQLNATGINISPLKKTGKATKKSKEVKRFSISFTISRNVTAAAGNRQVFVRLLKPNQQVVSQMGSFIYENRNIGYSAVKTIEYTGQEQHHEVYVNVNEYLSSGKYAAYIFADGQMIGAGSIMLEN